MSFNEDHSDDLALELTCPICLLLFNEPVSLPCGHIYCLACLQAMGEGIDQHRCPECQVEYRETEKLVRNFKMSSIVERYKASLEKSVHPPNPCSVSGDDSSFPKPGQSQEDNGEKETPDGIEVGSELHLGENEDTKANNEMQEPKFKLASQVTELHLKLEMADSVLKKEKERELEELMKQLNVESANKDRAEEDPTSCCEENQPLMDEADLQGLLRNERRKSANFELQANLFQRFMLNRHYEDQKTIENLMRQITIASQDLEDEKRDCSYLRKQMVKLLKMLPKAKRHGTEEMKRNEQDPSSYEDVQPPSHTSTDSLASSAHSDALNESFLECPSCQNKYAASQHQELLNHLEMCLE